MFEGTRSFVGAERYIGDDVAGKSDWIISRGLLTCFLRIPSPIAGSPVARAVPGQDGSNRGLGASLFV